MKLYLWVKGYLLCGGCEKGVHVECGPPCNCDPPGCGGVA